MTKASSPRPTALQQENAVEARKRMPQLLFLAIVLCLMFGVYQINYLLFHSFVEVFTIVVAGGIFFIAWHTQSIIKNSYFQFIGIAYLFIAILDLIHTLAYPGMGVFPEMEADKAIQLWVVTRFIQGIALVTAPALIHKKARPNLWVTLFAIASAGALVIVFVWPVLPRCFIPGQGLTLFKKGSEYLIGLILLVAIIRLSRQRAAFDDDVWRIMCVAIALTIASEIAFTLFVDPYGIANVVGNCLKFSSFFLVYVAIIETGLSRPHRLAVQTLIKKEQLIQEKEAVAKAILNATTDVVVLLDHSLRFVAANASAMRFFGFNPETFVGRRISEIIPAGMCGLHLDHFTQVLADSKPVQYEGQQEGAIFLHSIYPVLNDGGQVVQLAIYCKDITRQREAYQALVESEAKFHLLAERIEDVFWIATPDARRFVYVSPSYEAITGQPVGELYVSAKGLIANVHREDRPGIQAIVRKMPLDEWDIEFRIVRPDGAVRWIRNRGYSVKDEKGRMVQICGVARDVTNRKNLEQRLVAAHHEMERQVEDRTCALSVAIQQLKLQVAKRTEMGRVIKEKHSMLKTLVQAIPDRVGFKDIDGRYQLANEAFKQFFDIEGQKIIGCTDEDFKAPDIANVAMDGDREVIQQGRALRYESRLPSDSDTYSHWDVRKVPVKDSTGAIMGILSLSRDITAYKQREAQLKQSKATMQAFLDGISDPMVMMDQNLHLVYINRAAAEAYPANDSKGRSRTCLGILCETEQACSQCNIPTWVSKKERHSYERAGIGSPERTEMVDIYPLYQERDGLEGVIIRIRDITEAKHLERQMIHSEKMASLGMLISGIAHEINNPNSFITFNLPILKAYLEKILGTLDAFPNAVAHSDWFGMDYRAFRQEIFSLLDNLSHGSVRIDNIVANLKAMAHPNPSDQHHKWFDIHEVITRAVMLCRGEIRKRVKTFDVEQGVTSIKVQADPEGLEQVLINLLINASQAADKPDSWIRLRAIPPSEHHSFATIEVHDNGCGMDQATQDSIFDPFFTTKAPGVGTGLGLSMSYNLIGQMGGQINVESLLGQGSKFIIHLPTGVEEKKSRQMEQIERHRV